MNTPRLYFRSLRWLAGALLLLAVVFSCDVLENDVSPDTSTVDLTGKEIYTLPGGMAYIDLYAMVKTTTAVRLAITSQPSRGSLHELKTGFLQYVPYSNFKSGRDGFQFSIYSADNKLLKQDTVVIIVEPDSTQLPCGVYAVNDYIPDFNPADEIAVGVLDNDIICDTAGVKLEIFRPSADFPPHQGTASVLQGRFVAYQPNSNFIGTDTIMYKITSLADTTKVSYGVVVLAESYITPIPECEWNIADDYFQLDRKDTLFLPIFKNDTLCSNLLSGYKVNIVHAPARGTATVQGLSWVRYITDVPEATHALDSLVYQVCYDTTCRQAKTIIYLNP